MADKAKIFYFSAFILAVFALIFHVTAMGHHHWKRIDGRNNTLTDFNYTSIGLFTRCVPSPVNETEVCFPNKYPKNSTCLWSECLSKTPRDVCECDFLPSTKGIAACAILASIFLGLIIIILFVHSINTSQTESLGIILGILPLILLLLAFIFILITLILIGSYLSRDAMTIIETQLKPALSNLDELRQKASDLFSIRVDWSTGLDIIALFLTFMSLILYSAFAFKVGRK